MHSLKHAAHITEGKAMDVIFNACRANEKRETRTIGDLTVSFDAITYAGDTEHGAMAADANGFVQITAFVDETDV